MLEGFDDEELPGAFSRWVVSPFQRSQRGFCQYCSGRVRASLGRTGARADGRDGDGGARLLAVNYTCVVCGATAEAVLGAIVLDHPAVVAFHDAHGVDVRNDLVWELFWLFEPHATITGEDPLEIGLDLRIDDDRLTVRLDDTFAVSSVERHD